MRTSILVVATAAVLVVGAAPLAASARCEALGPQDGLLVVDVQNSFLAARPVQTTKQPQYPIPKADTCGDDICAGSLAVPDSAPVVDVVQHWVNAMVANRANVLASKDWHPAGHCSFCRNGTRASNPLGYKPHGAICESGVDIPPTVMNASNRCIDHVSEYAYAHDDYFQWPDHCIQGSFGAEWDPYLGMPSDTGLVYKGFEPHMDSYSAFGGYQLTGQNLSLTQIVENRGIRRLWVLGLALDFCVGQSTLDALGANPQTQRPAPVGIEDVILVRAGTRPVNATAGEAMVETIRHAGGYIVNAVSVAQAVAEFCAQSNGTAHGLRG